MRGGLQKCAVMSTDKIVRTQDVEHQTEHGCFVVRSRLNQRASFRVRRKDKVSVLACGRKGVPVSSPSLLPVGERWREVNEDQAVVVIRLPAIPPAISPDGKFSLPAVDENNAPDARGPFRPELFGEFADSRLRCFLSRIDSSLRDIPVSSPRRVSYKECPLVVDEYDAHAWAVVPRAIVFYHRSPHSLESPTDCPAKRRVLGRFARDASHGAS